MSHKIVVFLIIGIASLLIFKNEDYNRQSLGTIYYKNHEFRHGCDRHYLLIKDIKDGSNKEEIVSQYIYEKFSVGDTISYRKYHSRLEVLSFICVVVSFFLLFVTIITLIIDKYEDRMVHNYE